MDQFLLNNADRYNRLIGAVKVPSARGSSAASEAVQKDTIINIRIRPVLEDDEAPHILSAVLPRKGSPDFVDIHELRRPVRGPPLLKVLPFLTFTPYSA
jgi:kinesin family protein 2/24